MNVPACANCGKESGNAVKLKNCACLLVKYCSVDCQMAHRKHHMSACKKRVAELEDERLYGQGRERPEDDFCPVCTLPIPVPMQEHAYVNVCCMKRICMGCSWAYISKSKKDDCPFCRASLSDDNELAKVQARVDAKDPAAITMLGDFHYFGKHGLERNFQRSLSLWREAADRGSAEAQMKLGTCYSSGDGVKQDEAKARYHWGKSACLGHMGARHNLGVVESTSGNFERAVRHWMISAKMGVKDSLDNIKVMFAAGHATKQQYREALVGYQAATEETKSHEREKVLRSQESAALWEKRAKDERKRKEYYKRQLADTANLQQATDPTFHFTIPEEGRVFRTKAELLNYLSPQLREYGKDAKKEWIVEWCRELHRRGMITKDTMKTL